MSKTAIKIETGLLGIILITATVFFGFGQAGNSAQNRNVCYYGGQISPRSLETLHTLYEEVRDAAAVRLAESDRIQIENPQGELIEYSFAYNALWRNEHPVIMNIDAFHFEYRNDSGYAYRHSENGMLGIHAVMFLMRISQEEQEILANGRIQVRPQYHSFHDASEHEMQLVNSN